MHKAPLVEIDILGDQQVAMLGRERPDRAVGGSVQPDGVDVGRAGVEVSQQADEARRQVLPASGAGCRRGASPEAQAAANRRRSRSAAKASTARMSSSVR